MKVHDIMTKDAVSCRTDIDLSSAARVMLVSRVGTLPVVDPRGHVTGMLTDRDIAMAAGIGERHASEITVEEAMSARVRACQAHDEVSTALRLMEQARVRRLPVLDAIGRLVGIVSIDDILLRAVGEQDGIAPADFFSAMRAVCAGPGVEPDAGLTSSVSGAARGRSSPGE